MVQSVAAVPCGVTDYRQNLFKQTPYDAETSAAVIDIMEEFGDECKRRHGKRIIYPAMSGTSRPAAPSRSRSSMRTTTSWKTAWA